MRPSVSGLAEEAHELLGAISRPDGEDTQWALLRLLDALLAPLQPVEDLVRDDGDRPGYSQALDVDLVPPKMLRWLGQFKGVRVTLGDTTDPAWAVRAREEIRQAAGFRRGHPDVLVAAAKSKLSGNKSVRLLERDTSPYHATMIVRPSEVPASDLGTTWDQATGTWDEASGSWGTGGSFDDTLTTIVRDAVMAQKPVRLILAFLISDSPLIDEGTLAINDVTVATVDNATLDDVT